MPAPSTPPEPTELQAHLTALRAEVAALAKLVTENAQTQTRDTLKHLGIAGTEPLAKAQAELEALVADAKTYAGQKPIQAMGIAAGIGLLAGLLLARR